MTASLSPAQKAWVTRRARAAAAGVPVVVGTKKNTPRAPESAEVAKARADVLAVFQHEYRSWSKHGAWTPGAYADHVRRAWAGGMHGTFSYQAGSRGVEFAAGRGLVKRGKAEHVIRWPEFIAALDPIWQKVRQVETKGPAPRPRKTARQRVDESLARLAETERRRKHA